MPSSGQTLTASPGNWSGSQPITYAYQWLSCDANGNNPTPIQGETTNKHVVTAGDVGKTLRVRVTATNAVGSATADSNPTAVVTSTPPASGGPSQPSLSNPQTVTIPSTGGTGDNGEFVFHANAGVDYIVQFQGGVRHGPIWWYGNGRHLLFDGGEQIIDASSSSNYQAHRGWVIYDMTGVIHFEDYYLHGAGLSEGWNLQCDSGTFQAKNVRVEGLRTMASNPNQHPDCIQTWSINEVYLYNFTGYTNYQGFWWSRGPIPIGHYPNKVTMERVNIRCLDSAPIVPFALLSPKTEYRLRDVYVEIPGRGLKDAMEIRENDASGSIQPVNLWSWQEFNADGSPAGPNHGPASFVGGAYNYAPLSDNSPASQGDYIVFTNPSTDRIYELGSNNPGKVFAGVPSGGDYKP